MFVQSIAPTSSPLSIVEQRQGFSKIDWKIYSYVILSSLLVGIGIILACSSVYIATFIHPVIALTTPLPPILLGVLFYRNATWSPEKEKSLSLATTPPFLGIKRPEQNCWINTALQAIFNIPAFRKKMENLSRSQKSSLRPLVDAFNTYEKEQKKQSQKVSSVDTKPLRAWLSTLNRGVEGHNDVAHDPMQFMDLFFKKTQCLLPQEESMVVRHNDGTTTINSNKSNKKTPLPFFDLSSYLKKENSNLSDAFDAYFNHFETDGNRKETILRYLTKAPEDFSVSLGQADKDSEEKIIANVVVPMTLSFKKAQFGEDASYRCDAFFHHTGSSRGGHWTLCLYRNDQWWQINDETIIPLSDTVAQKYRNRSTFIHYQKVKTEY